MHRQMEPFFLSNSLYDRYHPQIEVTPEVGHCVCRGFSDPFFLFGDGRVPAPTASTSMRQGIGCLMGEHVISAQEVAIIQRMELFGMLLKLSW